MALGKKWTEGLRGGADGPLGSAAKAWVKAKKTELLTTDNLERDNARHDAWLAQRAMTQAGSEEVARAASPRYRDWQDRHDARDGERAAEAERVHRDEQGDLPVARVSLRTSGALDAAWDGELPLTWRINPPPPPGAGEEAWDDRDPSDPFATQALLALAVEPVAEQRPTLAGSHLVGVALLVHGYAGDGTYDLVAVAREREAAGVDALFECGLTLDDDESGYWFDAGAGPSSVVVDGDGTHAVAHLHLAGASGRLEVRLEVTRTT